MRIRSMFLAVCLLAAVTSGPARAEPLASQMAPQAGETVSFEADSNIFDLQGTLREVHFQVGNPDELRFELPCQTALPFKVTVLGAFDNVVVLHYGDLNQPRESGGCRVSSVITTSLNGWATLKRAHAEIAEARWAKAHRGAAIRRILQREITAPSTKHKVDP